MDDESKAEYCGSIDVPADHFNDSTGSIQIPFRWFESPDSTADSNPPVVAFNGGPGNSNLVRPFGMILQRFNVLSIGFRGVDGGPALNCPRIEQAITESKRILEDGPAAVARAIDACIDDVESLGYSASMFSVAQTVQDVNAVQSALAIDRVHLFAGSFGTRLGLVYQEVFPGDVANSVFVGANPPGRTIWRPDAIDAVLRRISAICSYPEACRVNADEMLAALRHRSPGGESVLGIAFDDERARIAGFLMSYDNGMMPYVAQAFLSASRGDSAGLLALSLAHDFAVRSSGIYWGHFVLMAASSDLDADEDYATTLADDGKSPFGSPLARLFWPAMPAERLSLVDPSYRTLSSRDHKTLIISGELDLSAPYEQIVEEILPFRPNSTHWIVPGAGHYNLYGNDLLSAAAEFLSGAEVTQPASVAGTKLNPAFGPGAILKILAVLIGVFSSAILFALFRMAKRMRSRPLRQHGESS